MIYTSQVLCGADHFCSKRGQHRQSHASKCFRPAKCLTASGRLTAGGIDTYSHNTSTGTLIPLCDHCDVHERNATEFSHLTIHSV